MGKQASNSDGGNIIVSDGDGSGSSSDEENTDRFESLKEWYESDTEGPDRRKIGTKPSAPIWQAFKNYVEAEHGMSHGVTAIELDAALLDRMGESREGALIDRVGEVETHLGEASERLGETETKLGETENRLGDLDNKLDTVMRMQNMILEELEGTDHSG